MAIPTDLAAVLATIDQDTTNLATVVADLRSKISTSMTQADVDAVQSTMSAVATRLEGIAKDPNAPVPAAPMPTFKKKP